MTLTEYALGAWQRPGLEAACLQLQDDYQLSVPLLLCSAWLQARACNLAPGSLLPAVQPVLDWERATVWPLRTLRRNLKSQLAGRPALAGLREQIKACEQAAEWQVLADLGGCAFVPGPVPALITLAREANLPPACEPFGALCDALSLRLNSAGPLG